MVLKDSPSAVKVKLKMREEADFDVFFQKRQYADPIFRLP